jgi:hypothetical protein
MSILVRFDPPSLTADQYDQSISKIQDTGEWPPDGLDYHVCFGTDGELKVSEIWDSEEKWQAFGERLMPVLSDVGIEPGEPTVIPIHNVVKR